MYVMCVTELTLTDIKEFPSFKFGNYTYALELDPPSPEFQEIARKELRETPELQKEAVARLRELLEGKNFIDEYIDELKTTLTTIHHCRLH